MKTTTIKCSKAGIKSYLAITQETDRRSKSSEEEENILLIQALLFCQCDIKMGIFNNEI